MTVQLNTYDLENVLLVCEAAAVRVSKTLQDNFGKTEYSTKAHANDWVTQWDRWAEAQLVADLEKFDSTIGILAEEGARKTGSELYWTVDPIDGTTHFVKGEAKCTTMIALVERGAPIASVIYDFVGGSLYTAATGLGAYKNKTEKLTINNRRLEGATLELNMHLPRPAETKLQATLGKQNVTTVQNFASGHAGILTASGAIDGMLYIGTSPPSEWDIAPVAALVSEAGGVVSNLESNEYKLGGNNFVNGCGELVEDMQQIYRTISFR
jgi:myo-inositol-1(or 4)-monophosphatase